LLCGRGVAGLCDVDVVPMVDARLKALGEGARRQVEQTDARVCAALVEKGEETGVVGRGPVLSLSSSRVSKGPDRQGAA
jgi:hypothetical protein